MTYNLTDLRKAILIINLCDGGEWNTKEILEFSNKAQLNCDQMLNKTPKKISPGVLSDLLNELVKERIIEKHIDKNKEGRGPAGYKYNLAQDFNSFIKIVKKLGKVYMPNEDGSINIPRLELFGSNFLEIDYTQNHINSNVIPWLETILEEQLDEHEKNLIWNILKISPIALYEIITFPEYIEDTINKLTKRGKLQDTAIWIKTMLLSKLQKAFNENLWNPHLKSSYVIESETIIKLKVNEPRKGNWSGDIKIEGYTLKSETKLS